MSPIPPAATSGTGVTGTGAGNTLGSSGLGTGTVNTAPGSDINPSLGTGVAPGSGVTGTDLSTTGSVSALGNLDGNRDGQVTLDEFRSVAKGHSEQERNSIMAGLTDLQRQQLRAQCQSAGATGGTQSLCQSLMAP